ncbi:MAG TPA: trypsin-like peptidase domain-containing protein [Acidimicrobiia bacterium]|jgi:putative serine protease PepD
MDRNDSSQPRRSVWLVVAIAAALVVGGVVGGVIVAATQGNSGASASDTCSATSVAHKVLPSVVTIAVTSGAGGGTGSGEFISASGNILTNNHVISSAANRGSIQVLLSDGTSADATIVGRDPRTDLAVIRIHGERSFPVIAFGSSADVEIGQHAIALGAPLGLSSTVTAGIVSALGRTVQVPADNGAVALLVSALQTDAAINPGNSGGALVDCSGRLIGVPTAGATVPNENGQSSSGSIGLGFAIPVDFARTIADELVAHGSVTHSFFGIDAVTTSALSGARAGTEQGLYVAGIVRGGPSDAAGLRAGDVITTIEGQAAKDTNQLAAITLTKKPGSRVEIGFERDGSEHTTTVVLGAQP